MKLLKGLCLFGLLCSIFISVNSSAVSIGTEYDHNEKQTNEIVLNDDITTSHASWLTQDDTLYQTDFYAPYYFSNLKKNYGYNVKGSCTYIAFDMLLSFYDTYWDDTFIPENYDMNTILSSENFNLDVVNSVESPATYGEERSLVYGKTTQEYYNIVEQYSNFYHHLKLIEIGKQIFGQYKFEDSSNPCGLYRSELLELADYYLYDVLGKDESQVKIVTNSDLNMSVKDFMIYMIKQGIPVELRAGKTGGGHAMVAYDYDSITDTIYVHPGWRGYSDDTHVTLSSTGYTDLWDATAIVPQTNHQYTNNYKYIDGYNITTTYCPSELVVPSTIEIVGSYNLDVVPTFQWNSLIKEKWFKNIGLYHELSILDSNRHAVYKKSKIYDNEYTLTNSEFNNILNLTSNDYYIYIGLASDVDPYWDDFYCCYSFSKPNTYRNKSSFLPSDWGFIGRYYFSNELTSNHLLTEPERKTTVVTSNGLTITTDRLRCGYIENSYVVLSPRRENAGRAYFEMNFDKAVYSFMYRACLWSSKENIDGVAVIQVKDRYGNWTTLKDIPLSQLKTKSNGLTQFVEQTSSGIYGLRFEITSTATGTTNKGRFCIDDIVFSTVSGTNNNTYVNCNYSTKA